MPKLYRVRLTRAERYVKVATVEVEADTAHEAKWKAVGMGQEDRAVRWDPNTAEKPNIHVSTGKVELVRRGRNSVGPKVLNRNHDPIPEEAVYIGRPSKWGNPFKVGRDGTRQEVIEKYRKWILRNKKLLGDLPELQGKDLVCWCAPSPCHGHILLELLEERREDELGKMLAEGEEDAR